MDNLMWRNLTFREIRAIKTNARVAARRSAISDHYRALRSHDPALARKVFRTLRPHGLVQRVPIMASGHA